MTWGTWSLLVVAGMASAALLTSCTSEQGGASKLGVDVAPYGKMPDGAAVSLYTLTNGKGMRVKLTNYGAITVSVEVPDKAGKLTDVTVGYDTLDGWLKSTSYFGATVGRYANRIANGKFTLDGQNYTLATNNGENALHGGIKGFDKVVWNAEPVKTADGVGVKFTYLSKDGEEGYPGNLSVTVVYTLNDKNEFKAEFSATTDKATVVNLAHHTYWNLGGPAAGDILGHLMMINADKYTPVDAGLIPTGERKDVAGTPMDFTTPKTIGERIAQVEGGYDHNYVLRAGDPIHLAAKVVDPKSGRIMEIFTDQPGVQFYSGNFLDGTVTGKGGVVYKKHYGFCLETQHFPDSPNKPDFPPVVLKPGETYKHIMIHKFSNQ
ncbi:MAG: galactose mutarotase [Planctomycetota bacterium]|nr:galactose mutarotase [Planctomycetota bacterium]